MILHRRTDKIMEIGLSLKQGKPGAAEILRTVFLRTGIRESQLAEVLEDDVLSVVAYVSARRAQHIKRQLSEMNLRKSGIRIRAFQREGWRDKWKTSIPPFALTSKFYIRPSWHKETVAFGTRKPIYIHTTSAFGTGLHETTRFMARLIEAYLPPGCRFLDIGTGTGLLAIIASKCGAGEVTCLDKDPESVRVALMNLKANCVRKAQVMECDFQKFRRRIVYDFVAANLFSEELIRFRKELLRVVSPGGFLAVSGIALENFGKVHKNFKMLPLRCRKIYKGRRWAGILYQKEKGRR